MIILNAGCGPEKIDGCINLDINPDFDPEVIHNLEVHPLPFKDESVHGIIASHILEHIRNLPELLEEFKRILIPGGVLQIRVPYYLSPDAWGDPTHVRAFSEQWFFKDFWPGWTVTEVSFVNATKTDTGQVCKHIHAEVTKNEDEGEGNGESDTNTDS